MSTDTKAEVKVTVSQATRHQQRPGTMMRKPNPTNPTPMMVADELTPRDSVMTSGTLPTTARLPPTPMNTSGVVSSPTVDLTLDVVTGCRELAWSEGIATCDDPGILIFIFIG